MTFLNYSNKLFVFVHSNPNLLAPNPIIETNVKKKNFEKEEKMNVTIELSKATLLSIYINYRTYNYTIKV